MAIEIVALDSEERIALFNRAAVDGDAGDAFRHLADGPSAHRLDHRILKSRESSCAKLLQRLAHFLMVGKMVGHAANRLAFFMALARDNQCVAGSAAFQLLP